jgi:hypothetical protein
MNDEVTVHCYGVGLDQYTCISLRCTVHEVYEDFFKMRCLD